MWEKHISFTCLRLSVKDGGLLRSLGSPYEQISARKKRPHLHTPAVLRMQRGLFWHKSACYTVALKWTLIGPSRYARVKHMAAGSFPHWYNALPTLMKLPPDHIQQSVHGEGVTAGSGIERRRGAACSEGGTLQSINPTPAFEFQG